jgi:tetratricopeptide (TPR) repeat protein
MTGAASDQAVEEARASFAAGDFRRTRDVALAALDERPADAALLRLAGRASLELDRDDAVPLLEKAVAADDGNADAWRDLGDALVLEGRLDDARDAFARAVELRPDDASALLNLGHLALAAGRRDEAVSHFQQVVDADPDNAPALRALTEAHRGESRFDDALASALRASESRPDDVIAALDAAELALDLGRLDDAEAAFRRVRAVDDDPEHEVYALHALIDVEVRRDRWRRALDLAVEATRVDRLGRTTDILAFVVTQVFGVSDRPAPERSDVDRALVSSRAEHKLLHADILR